MVRQLTNPPQRHDVVIAAARKITLTEVSSTVSGDIDLNGVLGLNPDVRNGYQQIKVRFTVKGDAPAQVLRDLVEQSRSRSAVYDVITNGVPVVIDTSASRDVRRWPTPAVRRHRFRR